MLVQTEDRIVGFSNSEKAFLTSLHQLSDAMTYEYCERVKALKKIYGIEQKIMCGVTVDLATGGDAMKAAFDEAISLWRVTSKEK